MSTDAENTWTLTFFPAPGHAAPMSVRVKRLLKLALRAFGLRCISVSGGPEAADKAPLAGHSPNMGR
jgi:hypothetical protein